MTSLAPAGLDGGLGTLVPGAKAIHRIKLNGVDPQRYLADLFARLAGGWPQARIGDPIPWHCSAAL
jgi:transposase IS66-like protein